MSKAAFTIKVFAVYLFGLGLGLMLLPNLLLALFAFAPTGEVWIRVLGFVVIELAICYGFAGVSEARPFFVATVFGRLLALLAFAAFAGLGLAKPTLILFGVVDTLGALWTWRALRTAAARA